MRYLIALGSNKGNRLDYLIQAKQGLKKLGKIIRSSSIYENPAACMTNQADFLNSVCELDSPIGALRLLRKIKQIETKLGRQRSFRWGPREIDLDIIDWDGGDMNTSILKIPHPEMNNRDFVLIPLKEIRENYSNRSDTSINRLISELPANNLKIVTNNW